MMTGRATRCGKTPKTGLSPTLANTLSVIREFIIRERMSPTMQELADLLGISRPTVHEQLGNLERKGYVRRQPRKSRSLEVIDDLQQVAALVTVPIIGAVAAGVPILAIEQVVGEVLVEAQLVRGRCFALVVQGDSMIDANIREGDLVIVRQQPLAENGDIVVAMLDGEATVKRLAIAEERIALQPANRKYRPILIGPDDELKILGKVVGVRTRAEEQPSDRGKGDQGTWPHSTHGGSPDRIA